METSEFAARTKQTTSCHECGAQMARDVRPRTLAYKMESEAVQLPGWYCDGCGESVHQGADMAASGQAIRRMKAFDEKTTQENWMNASVTLEQARARTQRFGNVDGPFHVMSNTSKFTAREVASDEGVPARAPIKADEDQTAAERGEGETA